MMDLGWPWDIVKLPFYYKPLTSPHNFDMPDFLPFTLDIDKDTGLLVQIPNPMINGLLEKAYQKGSIISGIMDDHGIGKHYADDFVRFIQAKMNGQIQSKRILEIGCGTGYLLNRLKQLGATVFGVEPGEHGQLGAQKYNVDIIQDFFPSKQIIGQFDLIIMYCVLEHVQNSKMFLLQVANCLDQDGQIIFAVPSCDPYIATGDVSMLFHEHFSYFSKSTLRQVFINAIGKDTDIEQSSFGGLLYGLTGSRCEISMSLSTFSYSTNYRHLAENHIRFMREYFAAHRTEQIGIYVAGRAINALSLLENDIDLERLRFFDDNSMLQDMYFPGLPIKMESRKQLCECPPDRILIMSFSFGESIKQELQQLLQGSTPVETIRDMLAFHS